MAIGGQGNVLIQPGEPEPRGGAKSSVALSGVTDFS